MNFLKSDKGYSLLFTLCTLVLISILGIGLVTLSSTGLMRNENRENVAQASDLSEKGIHYMSNKINKDLEQYIVDLKNGTTTVDTAFNHIFLAYGCTANSSKDIVIDGSTGKTNVCIEAIEDKAAAQANQRRNTRLVTLRSTGESTETKQAGSRTVIEFGFNDIPEQLSYAVSSNDNGNIYFFGGTEVRGNIKLAGDMYVSDKAFYDTVKSPDWVNSVYPKLLSHEPNKTPIIYSNKDYIYQFKDKMPTNVEDIYKLNTSNTTQFDQYVQKRTSDMLHETFIGTKPILRKYAQESQPFIIHEKPEKYKEIPSKFEEMQKLDKSLIDLKEGSFIKLKGESTVADNMVVYIKNKSNEKGNLYIGKYAKEGGSSNDPKDYYESSLSGNYYVDGNVHIKGAKLKSNAVIYAKGNVEIAYSTIEPLNNGTLFIFADGDIKINNISVDSLPGKGSIINGYFYTNKDFLMYGVGSNTTITGGLSARNIIYTTVRGNAEGKGIATPYEVPSYCQPFDLTCIKRITNVEQLTLNIPQANIDVTTDWISKLQNKVTGKRNKKYVNEHNLHRQQFITNEELEVIKTIINKPNSVKTDHLRAIQKIVLVADNIPKTMREFNYTDTRIHPIINDSINQYYMDRKREAIQQSLKTLYNYSITKLAQDCKNSSSNVCKSINTQYGHTINSSSGYQTTDSTENQLAHPSRLTIIYDRELVTRYSKTTEDDLSAVQELKIFKQKVHAMEPF